jgi:transcription elongation factor SPT6
LDEDGRFAENCKFDDLKDQQTCEELVDKIRKRRPDVIGVSGFSPGSRRLVEDIKRVVQEYNLTVQDDERDDRTLIDVTYVNDEAARLYQHSDRAKIDHPEYSPLVRYCCALARYVQNPLLEYAALGRDIVSIQFHPAQNLLNEDKLQKALESAMVDVVNLVGVQINEAVVNPYIANLLPYVCGLGPRKASHVLKMISSHVRFPCAMSLRQTDM